MPRNPQRNCTFMNSASVNKIHVLELYIIESLDFFGCKSFCYVGKKE
jgi:hypothetical protein